MDPSSSQVRWKDDQKHLSYHGILRFQDGDTLNIIDVVPPTSQTLVLERVVDSLVFPYGLPFPVVLCRVQVGFLFHVKVVTVD